MIDFKIDFQKIINFLFCAFFLALPVFYIPKVGTSYIFNQKLLVIAFLFCVFFLNFKNYKRRKIYMKWSSALLGLEGFFISPFFFFVWKKYWLEFGRFLFKLFSNLFWANQTVLIHFL
jgi:hypothetical protein